MRIGKPNILGYENVTVVYKPRPGDDRYPWVRADGIGRRWHNSDIREIHCTPEFELGTDSVRTGEGTSTELALAATVAIAVANHYSEPRDSFFVAGHEHEQLRKGAVSIAWEGGVYDWPFLWMQTEQARALEKELNVHFEALTSWGLAVFPGGH